MTQNNTQSVRNEAETATTAAATCRIPTFEEVYEMPYVQESIRSLIALAVHKTPILYSFQDDLRQEILLHLYEDLPRYNGRSDIKTFARLSIETGLKMAKRKLFSQKNSIVLFSEDIDAIPDDDSRLAEYVSDDVNSNINAKETEALIESIKDPTLRKVIDMLADGKPITDICKTLGIARSQLYRQLPKIKRIARKICSM